MNLLPFVLITALTLFVIVIAVFDVWQRRIPNFLVFPAILVAGSIHFIWQGWDGILFALKGISGGFGLLFLPYVFGGMKAGDVKFLMAIGAFIGGADTLRALLAALLCYPLIAVVPVIREGKLLVTWLRFRRVFFDFASFFMPSVKMYAIRLESQDDPSIASVTTPYGLALSIGTLLATYTNFLE